MRAVSVELYFFPSYTFSVLFAHSSLLVLFKVFLLLIRLNLGLDHCSLHIVL